MQGTREWPMMAMSGNCERGWPVRGCLRAAVLLLSLAAACETPVEQREFSEITFGHLPPISLDVAAIDIVVAYQPSLQAPNVEYEFPVPPASAAERWAADRLRAVGASGRAVVTIVDASVIEVALKKSAGLKGLFTTDQSERYDATVRLTIEVADLNRQLAARAEAEAKRSRSVSESVTLAEREQIWFALTETLMADFDGAMEEQIRAHLADFLK